jgi:hypothetical protein
MNFLQFCLIAIVDSVFRLCVFHFLIVDFFIYVLFNNVLRNSESIRANVALNLKSIWMVGLDLIWGKISAVCWKAEENHGKHEYA